MSSLHQKRNIQSQLIGAFQLFRVLSGESDVRELAKIPVGSCGYKIPWLQLDSNISSCCMYVVPCQMKLSVQPEIKEATVMIV